MVGYIAKGLVIAGAGVLVVGAASRSQPNTTTGLDGALNTLGAQPYGAALLIAAGLGIITYGLYSFAMGPLHQNVSGSGGLSLLASRDDTTLATPHGWRRPKQGITEVRSCVRPAAQNTEVPAVQIGSCRDRHRTENEKSTLAGATVLITFFDSPDRHVDPWWR